ncbi:MAG: hypothetical protein ABSB76_08915 [Streptosporangiaceae bacterium]
MVDYRVIDRINELLDSTDDQTVNTSMRIPGALRDAAALAVTELDLAPSTTILTANALRMALEAAVVRAVLDRHYEEYPDARPTLAELAIVAAELDGHPLASSPELVEAAAAELQARHPAARPEDVLLWAEARTSAPA